MNIDERRKWLEDMYPDGYLPAGEKAVSLPDTELGFETIAKPAADVPPPEAPQPRLSIVRDPEPTQDELPEPSAPIASNEADPRATVREAKSKSRGPNWLAGIAAFTQNPALLQMLRERREKPQRDAELELKRSTEARAAEKWEAEKSLYPHKAGKMDAEAGKFRVQSAAGALGVAGTPESGATRDAIADKFDAQAATMAGTEWGSRYTQLAKSIRGNQRMSGMAALELAKQWNVAADDVARDAESKFKQGETSRMNDQKIGVDTDRSKQGWARISAARERALQPKEPSERVKAAQAKNQEKLDDEIEKAEWARNALLSVSDLKKNVNTGPVAGRAQDLLQKVDLSSDDYNKLKGRLSMVSNRIIKELSGSAVTGNEWQRMQDELANILNDDSNFESKLADMIDLTENIKQRAINRYTRGESGAPVQPSNTAARVTAQTPKIVKGETPPPDATPGRADPQKAAKVARAQAILADPNESPEKKAKAQKWLELNK